MGSQGGVSELPPVDWWQRFRLRAVVRARVRPRGPRPVWRSPPFRKFFGLRVLSKKVRRPVRVAWLLARSRTAARRATPARHHRPTENLCSVSHRAL